jgi:peroxiredoxin
MIVFTRIVTARAMCLVLLLAAASPSHAETVLYNGATVKIDRTLKEDGNQPHDLWVTAEDLTRINGLVLKPPGVVCLDDLCISLTQKGDGDLLRERDGAKWVNLTGLATKLRQAYAVDRDTGTWSFAPIPATRAPFLKSAVAPNFELPNRRGKIIRLSDFRGRKVLLMTWASWCGCRLDVPKWEPLYQKLKDKGFEIISVAEDTAGEAAAGPIFDAAHVSFVTIIDPDHKISALYNFVNVPSAAWIDEAGHVVRINEGTYAAKHKFGRMEFGTNDYLPAVEDWVKNGAKSKYAWTPEETAKRIRPQSMSEARAEALFALGVHFYKQQNKVKANHYWTEAESLYPDSWNIHRQDWAITDKSAQIGNWSRKVRSSKKPYYAPLDLEK